MLLTRLVRRTLLQGITLALMLSADSSLAQVVQTPLAGTAIPRFVDPVPTFVGNRVNGTHPLRVTAMEFQQQVLPASMYTALPVPFNAGTYVWGYKIDDLTTSATYGPLFPGYTVVAQRGIPTSMTFVNALVNPVLQNYLMYDQTIHWAAPTGHDMMNMTPYMGPIPIVTHLHGGEVPSAIDGGPDAWFTPNSTGPSAYTGSAYNAPVNGVGVENTYVYPNTQEAATLWFHDHALGATRLNVYGGLAAFYFLRGGQDTGPGNALSLPADPYEIELAIQDRQFDTNGQLYFPHLGINPMLHPFWLPEFFGDVIVVNGKAWPYLNVEPRRYRFRLLNGSNARFYELTFGQGGPALYQIGTDGGLMDAPVPIAFPQKLLIAPGERADVIVDFSASAGATLILTNSAKAPYPSGAPPSAQTVGKIMQFRVGLTATGVDNSFNPAVLNATLRSTPFPKLVNYATGTAAVTADVTRRLTLNEIMGMAGPQQILVNNTKWDGMMSPNAGGITELPRQGSTELWEIINLTADAHPIHLHLVQFQLVNRQNLQTNKYLKAYNAAFTGGVSPINGLTYLPGAFIPGFGPPLPYASTSGLGYLGGNPDPTGYLQGAPVPADLNERGWKDTYKMYPGQVTRVLVRFAPTDIAAGQTTSGTNYFSFNPTEGPGYVWHCHIIDHEDNEMMRPYQVTAPMSRLVAEGKGTPLPRQHSLEQNYPNPFNPSTQIRFSLPEDSHVQLTVFNVLGEKVKTLIDNEAQAGIHTVHVDAGALQSGVYYYRIQAGAYTATRTMMLAK